jgi:type IV pilus assembly protein PilB
MLGEILLERGVVNRAQLRLGLVHHHEVRVPLGRALVREGLCTESDVLHALSDQLGIGCVALEKERLEPKLARLIPARIAQQYRVVPLRMEQRDREVLHVALSAPASIEALDAVRAISGKPRVEPHLASDTALTRALTVLYGLRDPPLEPVELTPSASGDSALLLYGWPPVTSVLMSRVLSRHGYETRVVTPLEVFHAGPSDIVLAPMQAMEGLLMGEARLNSALIIHGDSDGEGFERAQALGARGFLANPLDEELLLRAIHRLRPPVLRGARTAVPRTAPAQNLSPS